MKDYNDIIELTRVRYDWLTDTKILNGLSKERTKELKQINHLLDASEDEYYEPIKRELANLTIKVLEEQAAQMRTAIEWAMLVLGGVADACSSDRHSHILSKVIRRLERSLK